MPAHRTGVRTSIKVAAQIDISLPVVVYNSSFLDLPTSLCNAHKNSRLTHIDTMPMPLVLQPTILALHAQTRAVMTLP
ncbi:unnamed protein product [Fusarium graminearum]|nr:unnamed protein product [Fusarium graminearum]CAG1977079.1 unnamed protein product [Fusarium graminearum]CAG2001347.1 unnamed protein product [Fusarium graminearum]VTO93514.1 unnamed protein product [Fusarium graminearum]